MTIKEIVTEYLKANGYDALLNSRAECGCYIDDLMFCGECHEEECVPAYRHTCDSCRDDECEYRNDRGAWTGECAKETRPDERMKDES